MVILLIFLLVPVLLLTFGLMVLGGWYLGQMRRDLEELEVQDPYFFVPGL